MTERSQEKRKHPRVHALLRIDYEHAYDFLVDYITDLSKGGLFIRTQMPMQAGDTLAFTISFPGLLEPIPLKGVVRRVSTDPDMHGLGVEFLFQDEEERTRIESLVEKIKNASRLQEEVDRQDQEVVPGRFKILLVDDNPLVLELFTHALRQQAIADLLPDHRPEILTAQNSVTALKILKTDKVDFLILDHYMPGMSGISLLRIVRDDPQLADLPILMISTDKEELKIESLRQGANLFVAKPIQAATLLTTLTALLSEMRKP